MTLFLDFISFAIVRKSMHFGIRPEVDIQHDY